MALASSAASLALIALLAAPTLAHGKSNSTRATLSAASWQEPLKLQTETGTIEMSVANYKGYLASVERILARDWGGFAIGALIGSGEAAGGGTSSSVNYSRGGVAWKMLALQPRVFRSLSDKIAVGAGAAVLYRYAEWGETDFIRVTPSRAVNLMGFADLDLAITERLGFRQSYGVWSTQVGPFWRWGATYTF